MPIKLYGQAMNFNAKNTQLMAFSQQFLSDKRFLDEFCMHCPILLTLPNCPSHHQQIEYFYFNHTLEKNGHRQIRMDLTFNERNESDYKSKFLID